MQTVPFEAQTRELLSRGQLNALRNTGVLPAIVYGASGSKTAKSETTLLQVNEKNFLKMVTAHQWSNLLIDLKWSGGQSTVVIKEIQRDSVSRKLLHIDFHKISMTEKLELMVPVHLLGESTGVKNSGGILEHLTRELKIMCLPKNIPNEITVDISSMEVGHSIHVRDLPALPGVEVHTDPNAIVVHVVSHVVAEETPAATATAPGSTEPEVIKKGKKPEEGEAEETAAGKPGAAKPAAAGKPAAAKPASQKS